MICVRELETAVREYLTNGEARAVQTLIGQRFYPLVVPETAVLPAVAYQRISTLRVPGHDGSGKMARVRLQLRIVARSQAVVRETAVALRWALHAVGLVTWAGVRVHSCFLDSEADEYGGVGERFYCRQDYMVLHEEI